MVKPGRAHQQQQNAIKVGERNTESQAQQMGERNKASQAQQETLVEVATLVEVPKPPGKKNTTQADRGGQKLARVTARHRMAACPKTSG